MTPKRSTIVEVSVKDVIGPLLDMGAMIVMEAEGKVFPVKCTLADAESCHQFLTTGNTDGPYAFVKSVLDATGVSVTGAFMVEREGALYSSVGLKRGNKIMRIASDKPAMAINFSLYSKCPLTISEECLHRVKDSNRTYNDVRCEIRMLWPMAPLNKTRELQVMSEYMEDAFPDGSSPVTTNDDGRP